VKTLVYRSTMSDMRVADLRSRLEAVPSKKLSAFISEAVRAKLNPDAKTLQAAYRVARKEQWRTSLADDWSHIGGEGWNA
jgi:hypothetical protein